MRIKMTSRNQLTLPRSLTEQVGAPECFEVEVRDGRILLTPAHIQRGDSVRERLEGLGIDGADIGDAIAWARQRRTGTPATIKT
ncbi:AbrB family transcriptional regulator [Variovorax sp. WS11]|nr:AbrB/MazE/SpoVT family DNA-binding domain-containing protein [Variovorax sp. WS11]PSL86401.1 AbrB family transcriptional regulator [Variovorax sp. WS11]